jgi:KUP system potassium uptake protein
MTQARAVSGSRVKDKAKQGLILAALGVVYGDIGTSPLYTVKQCFDNVPVGETSVLGVLSLIAWALFIVVAIK